jgi:hypothetical protein
MCEPNQNPKGGKGEENRSSDIQGKEASVKVRGAKTGKDKPDKTEEPEP